MRIERFEQPGLCQYSYLIVCEASGQALVVDAKRQVDEYLEFASDRGLEITHVLDTHIHADFVSGSRELAELTGATLCLSGYDKDQRFEVLYPHQKLYEGDAVELGRVTLRVLHTPGHTPEHLSYLIYDGRQVPAEPYALLSGDFYLVGSIGRPDLIEGIETGVLAGKLFESLQKLKALPDTLRLMPAHGPGSFCGVSFAEESESVLGVEKRHSPYLSPLLEKEQFVEEIAENLPPVPSYYPRVKELNSKGAPFLSELKVPRGLPPAEAARLQGEGAQLLDIRPGANYCTGHAADAIAIPYCPAFALWAGWILDAKKPIVLMSESPAATRKAIDDLRLIGLDDVEGYVGGHIEAWREAQLPVKSIQVLQPQSQTLAMRVVDVRFQWEWDAGHIEGAVHVPAYAVRESVEQLREQIAGPMAIICGGGFRSIIAASLLEGAGFSQLHNMEGGMRKWRQPIDAMKRLSTSR